MNLSNIYPETVYFCNCLKKNAKKPLHYKICAMKSIITTLVTASSTAQSVVTVNKMLFSVVVIILRWGLLLYSTLKMTVLQWLQQTNFFVWLVLNAIYARTMTNSCPKLIFECVFLFFDWVIHEFHWLSDILDFVFVL